MEHDPLNRTTAIAKFCWTEQVELDISNRRPAVREGGVAHIQRASLSHWKPMGAFEVFPGDPP